MTAEISAAVICGWFVLDHSFDHLRLWTTWKQCDGEHPKASFSDTKAPKSLVNQGKNRCRFVWELDAAGSSPVTSTKIAVLTAKSKPQGESLRLFIYERTVEI